MSECITCGRLFEEVEFIHTTACQTLECCSEKCLEEIKFFIKETDDIIKAELEKLTR